MEISIPLSQDYCLRNHVSFIQPLSCVSNSNMDRYRHIILDKSIRPISLPFCVAIMVLLTVIGSLYPRTAAILTTHPVYMITLYLLLLELLTEARQVVCVLITISRVEIRFDTTVYFSHNSLSTSRAQLIGRSLT